MIIPLFACICLFAGTSYASMQQATDAQLAGNNQQAIRYYMPYAKINNSEAQVGIGSIYFKLKEYKQSFYWYQKAAKFNNSNAMSSLASFYLHGFAVPKNEHIAYHYVLKAAHLGNPDAENNIALYYLKGIYVKKNSQYAKHWFEKAARDGSASSYYNLGIMYYFHLGIKQNRKKAVELFRKGAKLGSASAQAKMGELYASGKENVGINYPKSYMWLTLAANQGNLSAIRLMQILTPSMTQSQIIQAQLLLREYNGIRIDHAGTFLHLPSK